jgi:hypothetical protein
MNINMNINTRNDSIIKPATEYACVIITYKNVAVGKMQLEQCVSYKPMKY